jgi:hypothetical protein
MFGEYNHPDLIGTQTIYSLELQNKLVDSFLNESELRTFYFHICNNTFHPTFTSDIPINMIFVSDEAYSQYFQDQSNDLKLEFFYNLSKVKHVKLKRIQGNFPRDDSLEQSLTKYFEKCMVINLHQEFSIQYSNVEFIKFAVTKIVYQNEPVKELMDRIDELSVSMKLTQAFLDSNLLSEPIDRKYALAKNFPWYYHTVGNQTPHTGDVSFQNVEVDFEESQIPPVLPPKKVPVKETAPPPPPEETPQPKLSPEELRQKRLKFLGVN